MAWLRFNCSKRRGLNLSTHAAMRNYILKCILKLNKRGSFRDDEWWVVGEAHLLLSTTRIVVIVEAKKKLFSFLSTTPSEQARAKIYELEWTY